MHRFIGRVFRVLLLLCVRTARAIYVGVQVQFQSIVLFAVPIVFALHYVLVEGMFLTYLRYHRS